MLLWSPSAAERLSSPSSPGTIPDLGPIQLRAAGRCVVDGAWSTGRAAPYRSLVHAVVLLHAGQAAVEIDGVWTELRSDAAVVIPAHHLLRRRTTGFDHTWIHFAGDRLSLDLHLARAPAPLVLPAAGLVEDALAVAARWPRHQEPALSDVLMVEALLQWILGRLLAQAGPLPGVGGGLVARAVDLLDRTYRERPAIQALARDLGCSPNHLQTAFREAMGITPARYAEQRRLRDGELLLRTTDLPVGEVARRCGYGDPFHFSRALRRQRGLSPVALRRQAWWSAP